MSARTYRPHVGGRVIRVATDSLLEAMVADSGAYELVVDDAVDELDELEEGGRHEAPPADTGAGDPGTVATDVVPPVPPVPPAPAPAAVDPATDPAAAALLAAAYAVDTAEGVNSYLDEHPYAAELVLEHERATKARKGILEGRHAAPSAQ